MALADNNLVTGNPMAYTRRAQFTPIWNSATVQVTSSNVGFHWFEGQHFCCDVTLSVNAGSSAQVVEFTLPQVNGQQVLIDTPNTSGQGNQNFTAISLAGVASWLDQSGGGFRILEATVWNSSVIRFYHNAGYLDGTLLAAADSVKFQLKLPVAGR